MRRYKKEIQRYKNENESKGNNEDRKVSSLSCLFTLAFFLHATYQVSELRPSYCVQSSTSDVFYTIRALGWAECVLTTIVVMLAGVTQHNSIRILVNTALSGIIQDLRWNLPRSMHVCTTAWFQSHHRTSYLIPVLLSLFFCWSLKQIQTWW